MLRYKFDKIITLKPIILLTLRLIFKFTHFNLKNFEIFYKDI